VAALVLVAALCCGSALGQSTGGATDESGHRRLSARAGVDRKEMPQIGGSVMLLGKFDWEISEYSAPHPDQQSRALCAQRLLASWASKAALLMTPAPAHSIPPVLPQLYSISTYYTNRRPC